MNFAGREQRRRQRSLSGLQLLTEGAEDTLVDYVENISTGGALCTAKSDVPIMSKISLAFELPPGSGTRHACDGVVVRRIEGEAGQLKVALVFTNLPAEVREAIEDFVAKSAG